MPPVEWYPALDRWPTLWCVNNVYILAEDLVTLQARRSALVESAAAYGIPLSEGCFDILSLDGGEGSISLSDG